VIQRLAAVLLCAFAALAQEAPPPKSSISGTVVDGVTGQPLAKVEVLLEASSGPPAGAASDAKGTFTLVNLDPGSYHLHLRRNGYLDAYYGARRTGTHGTTLTLRRGQDIKDVKCELAPFGVIAGTIREPDGEPVPGAAVVLVHMQYEEGVRKAESRQFAITDDLGQYRLAKLPPGKYFLGAAPPDRTDSDEPGTADHSADAEHRILSLQAAFYPGVRDPAGMRPIEVSSGARITGIDITLPRTHTVRVSGRLVIPTGVQAGDLTLRTGAPGEFVAMFDDQSASAARDGKFEFHSVPPGQYELTATGKSGRTMYLARAQMMVGDSDVEAPRLELAPRPEVAGRIVMADGTPPNWSASAIEFIGGPSHFSAGVSQDGAFSAFVLPGRYDLIFAHGDGPPVVFVKSLRSGQTDLFRDGVPVPDSGVVPVEMVLSRESGGVDGVAVDAEGKPLAGATVVLVPEPGLRRRYDLFRDAATDQNGRFEFKTVPPGEYKLFAWDDVEPGVWHDPDFLKNFEKQGRPVSVKKDGREAVKLTIAR
jgi:protocatechuate 3,4-dioxygenase beta subunit